MKLRIGSVLAEETVMNVVNDSYKRVFPDIFTAKPARPESQFENRNLLTIPPPETSVLVLKRNFRIEDHLHPFHHLPHVCSTHSSGSAEGERAPMTSSPKRVNWFHRPQDPRKLFSPERELVLEKAFHLNCYPTREMRTELANLLKDKGALNWPDFSV